LFHIEARTSCPRWGSCYPSPPAGGSR
jgi:hypothetical protein